jgi:hypothetical protein
MFPNTGKGKGKGKGKVYPRTGQEGTEGKQNYSFTLSLTLTLYGVGGQRYAPADLPRERTGTHCTGGWVCPRTGLDGCGKSRPHPPGFFPRTVHSVAQSLYRLSYPGPQSCLVSYFFLTAQ